MVVEVVGNWGEQWCFHLRQVRGTGQCKRLKRLPYAVLVADEGAQSVLGAGYSVQLGPNGTLTATVDEDEDEDHSADDDDVDRLPHGLKGGHQAGVAAQPSHAVQLQLALISALQGALDPSWEAPSTLPVTMTNA